MTEGLECLECSTCGGIINPQGTGVLKIGHILFHAKCCEVVVNFHGKRVSLSDNGLLTRVEITLPPKHPEVKERVKKCARPRKPRKKKASEKPPEKKEDGDYGLNRDINAKFSRLGDLI